MRGGQNGKVKILLFGCIGQHFELVLANVAQ